MLNPQIPRAFFIQWYSCVSTQKSRRGSSGGCSFRFLVGLGVIRGEEQRAKDGVRVAGECQPHPTRRASRTGTNLRTADGRHQLAAQAVRGTEAAAPVVSCSSTTKYSTSLRMAEERPRGEGCARDVCAREHC